MLSRIGVKLAVGLLKLFALLPYGFVARLGDGLGWLLYQIPSRRRRIVHINLKLCFPEWSDERREEVAQKHFRHAIRSYVERSVQWFGSAKKLEKLIEVVSDVDLLDPDMPPTLLLGFHFVGIEAGSVFINYSLHRPCGSLYQPMSNPELEAVAKAARGRFDAELASRADSARIVLRWLRERKPVMLGADMDYGMRNSTFVPFFGVQACTLTAVGRFAKVGRAQVLPFIGEVLPNYKGYRLRVFKPWENYPTGDDEADARYMNAFLEEQILRMPEQYYWVHKRFKTRPPGEPGFY
ncbi:MULTISPECIES: lipid A biosynthesis lauroyl acyltransferase [Paraburkholderia]|jgi:KDO2-lipid IV(A) lauroyltransferase|uniref:KDO2-lipid IV(A) lauroyltransferase n=1 Tax=Paraburkholderia megapolitana TaxID=420953 RepID=A0A1I3UZE0_9BURK|nr:MULTISPECIES: lipid A biosynthesis lauroyl acyltransferase [Paraburkholderia]MCX4163766.1 lipid A biosynthesis lauroyl acyltransferase [Paraburkholderia megapolitana]MDN7159261.1 lipid A biosynthesis lauroyl acyltransferase [Paraburkholderia sp. CHISQ3]MDQ6496308.1 lipid A biosynthesis lauroyl acyltransferase [Paraburkholderia megapolitana]QDQ82406.1 lipid A biosynthesis lauroyl acyltransferase [Paraburkholderia megapolitana]SFJ87436.1 KDO2-lipid IV(A) lauroyltransferase [Paraburkholderia m